jgi:hypothetical protein
VTPAHQAGPRFSQYFLVTTSSMEIVAALLLAFGLAAYLRFRRWPALRAIVLASLLSPATITFAAYVFPAEPEFRMRWHITVVTSGFFGLCAAAAGYALVVFMQRQRA